MSRAAVVKSAVVLSGLITLAVPVSGYAQAGPIWVFGAGSLSCGTWLQHSHVQDADHFVMAAWIDGYLTATNAKRSEAGLSGIAGKDTDNGERDAWITLYCQAHPLDKLFIAAKALASALASTGN
jgi:hypothetical protein